MDSLQEGGALLTAPACLAKEDYFRQHHLWLLGAWGNQHVQPDVLPEY